METYAVVLVESTNQAMRIEHVLHLAGIESKLIPVPKFLSSVCGNCLRIDPKDIQQVKEVIKANKIIEPSFEIIQM